MAEEHKKNGSTTADSPIAVCKACGLDYPEGAKICINCGSPTSSFSRFAHTHRSLITAIGAVLAFLTVVGLFCNLWVTHRSFVEQFQPRLETEFSLIEDRHDSLRITIDMSNKGSADALQINGSIYYLLSLRDTFAVGQYARDRLAGHTHIADIGSLVGLHSQSFFVSYDISYIWSGENEPKQFKRHYQFRYDPRKREYHVRRITREDIPTASIGDKDISQ